MEIEEIDGDIRDGLKSQQGRIQDAYDQLQFSLGRFAEYPTRTKDGRWKSGSTRRTSRIMARVVDVLCRNLYKAQPTRKIPDQFATEFLASIYKYNGMGPKWKRADELTLISGFAAWQFRGTEDPANPLQIILWGADEIAVYTDPDDPVKPVAVATLDQWNKRRRLRLYTSDQIVTYATAPGGNQSAVGAVTYTEISRIDNPYRTEDGEGILPFEFAHWCFPSQRFTYDSPGHGLKELNEHVNERLDRGGDAIFYLGRPVGIASGVDESWVPPVEIKPGDFITLPAAEDAGGNGSPPTLSYLLPELGFIAADWTDLNFYIDHYLETVGVPPVLMRMIQSGARSGDSIQSEQLPLLTWCEGRRADWAHYESAAGKKALQVTSAHYRNNEMMAEADQLEAAIDAWDMTLRWAPLWVQLPGPERDAANENRLKNGYVSKVGVVMEDLDMSEADAFEHLRKVKEQNDQLQALGINPAAYVEPTPFGGAAPFGGIGDQGGQDGQDEETGDE